MRKIESIQVLRAVASICVILCHISFVRTGAFGVDIFFAISGFLMMYTTKPEKGLEKYWYKKIIRIVPFYWFMTIITAIAVKVAPSLFNSYEVSMVYLLKSMFFIPYEHSGIYQPVLGLGYTLNYEMFFYLLFFISAKIALWLKVGKNRGIICSVMLLILVGMNEQKLPMPFAFWCDPVMLNFVLGIAVYYLIMIFDWEKCIEKNPKVIKAGCEGLAVAVILFLWIVPIPKTSWMRVVMWSVPTAVLLFAVIIPKWKNIPKILLVIGNASYYIYLIHPYCVRLTEKIVGRVVGYNMCGYILIIVIGVLTSILCGCFVYLFIRKYSDKVKKLMELRTIK